LGAGSWPFTEIISAVRRLRAKAATASQGGLAFVKLQRGKQPPCYSIFVIGYWFTDRCRDEIAWKRARRRKSVAGCRAAAFSLPQRRAEKAQNDAAPFGGARGKVRRFEIMLIPYLISKPGESGRVADRPGEINLQQKRGFPKVI
jgi:hypothetical protein